MCCVVVGDGGDDGFGEFFDWGWVVDVCVGDVEVVV